MLKRCVLSSFLNTAGLAAARMSGGSEFNAACLPYGTTRNRTVPRSGVTRVGVTRGGN